MPKLRFQSEETDEHTTKIPRFLDVKVAGSMDREGMRNSNEFAVIAFT